MEGQERKTPMYFWVKGQGHIVTSCLCGVPTYCHLFNLHQVQRLSPNGYKQNLIYPFDFLSPP